MVFLKHFDTSKQTLRGIGKCYAQRTAKVADLVPTINERMRWPAGTPLKLFEVRCVMAYPLSLHPHALLIYTAERAFACRKSNPA